MESDRIKIIRLKRLKTGSTILWRVVPDNGVPINMIEDYVDKIMPNWIITNETQSR